MALDQSDYIALAAVAVSILSAIYAKRAVNEAKKANDISLHVHKVEIYEEVISFSGCFRGLFSVPTAERLEQFRKKAVQKAEIYLSEETYLLLKEVYEHCSENEVWLNIAESEGATQNNVPTDLEVRSQYKSVLNILHPAIQSIKKEARLNHA